MIDRYRESLINRAEREITTGVRPRQKKNTAIDELLEAHQRQHKTEHFRGGFTFKKSPHFCVFCLQDIYQALKVKIRENIYYHVFCRLKGKFYFEINSEFLFSLTNCALKGNDILQECVGFFQICTIWEKENKRILSGLGLWLKQQGTC